MTFIVRKWKFWDEKGEKEGALLRPRECLTESPFSSTAGLVFVQFRNFVENARLLDIVYPPCKILDR
jgi:hypothetical protein